MSLTLITDRIKAEAAQRIQQVQAEADKQCERLIADSQLQIEKVKKEATQATAKKVAQQHTAITSQAKQTGSLLQQKAKRQVLDSIFETVYSELQKMSGEEYVAFFTKQINAAQLDDEVIELVGIPAGKESESQQILANLNITAPVEIDQTLTAGVRFTSGSKSYDFSLATLFSDKRVDLEVMVVNDLFGSR